MRRLGLSMVLAGSLLAVTATAVAAHECTIASRSAQGDSGALHSSRWVRLTLQDVFGFIGAELGGRDLTADEIDQAVEMAVDAGLPANGWVIRSDKTIGEGSSNPNLANGKGLDHLIDSAGPTIVGIYFQIAGPPAP
jgi:hypothetical protein